MLMVCVRLVHEMDMPLIGEKIRNPLMTSREHQRVHCCRE